MAIAISQPVPIPTIPNDYLTTLKPSSSSLPIRSISSPVNDAVNSPGGTRRMVPAGQLFGRYQHPTANETSITATLTSKTPSTMSLEALAALLSSSPEEYSYDLSPPARSKGYHSSRPKDNEPFRKSKSFPIVKPSQQSAGHRNVRPPLRKARSVKFADSKGLPLESVRKLTAADPFQTEGEIVPKLLTDLGALSLAKGNTIPLTQSLPNDKNLTIKVPPRILHFNQPGTQPDFYNKVKLQLVSLESVSTSQPRAIHGIVRVMNIAYDKDVSVRWTHDKWNTHHESKCLYCQGSSDGITDRFSFTLPANGDDVEFAICYKTQGIEYWDSHAGQNYLISVEHH